MKASGPAPLLDPSVLDKLLTDVGDDEKIWKLFVRNFIAALPHRTDKVRGTLTSGDLAGSLDAVLSLKSSSQMVGAERLADLSADLERSVRVEARHAVPGSILPRLALAHLTPIIKCGRQTTNLLEKYLHVQARNP
ncbi:Hpt domain-containing protein [Arthrobacter sp. UYCo732]|uniref:Hpt domain-containing protein n=1 Tax=Arthrobacter sp. UYCo732 TaxID=3156336 RepID=UPI0033980958